MFELAAVWAALRARRARHPYAWIAATGVLHRAGDADAPERDCALIPLGFAAVSACGPRVKRATVAAREVGGTVVTATGVHGRPDTRTGSATDGGPDVEAAGAVALLLVTTVLTIAPWTIRNAVELHHFIPVSDETGITLVGTYNPTRPRLTGARTSGASSGRSPRTPDWFATPVNTPSRRSSDKLESQALDYIGDHPLAPLEVAYHNTLRMFELEGTYAWHASAIALEHSSSERRTGVVAFWLLCLLALAGDRDARCPRGTAVALVRSRCCTRSASCSSTSRRPGSASRSTRS